MMTTNVPPNDRKVFVGGLAPHTTEQTLALYFSQFGEVEEIKLILDRATGRSKCYGFVSKLLQPKKIIFYLLYYIHHCY